LQMQEKQRLDKEARMKEKLARIESKNRQKEEALQGAIEKKRQHEMNRFNNFKQNYESVQMERQIMNEQYLLKANKTSKLSGTNISRRNSHSSGCSPDEKLKIVQEEAKKRQEEKKSRIGQKMDAFHKRMKKKDEEAEKCMEERKEQAREWTQTLKINVSKKKKKDEYRRELMETKLKAIEKKQRLYEEHKDLMRKERFYAKISNEMKAHYIKEALHDMSLKKNWSLEKLENIMTTFQPTIQEGVMKDKKQLDNNINKVLADPFHAPSKKDVHVIVM